MPDCLWGGAPAPGLILPVFRLLTVIGLRDAVYPAEDLPTLFAQQFGEGRARDQLAVQRRRLTEASRSSTAAST
jgi:hypothetical protein